MLPISKEFSLKRDGVIFNSEKCTFGVKAGKFLDFYLTERGIEAKPDKF